MIFDRLFIDPGVNTGWTGVSGDNLRSCGLVRAKKQFLGLPKARLGIVIETPVIYPYGKQKARPKDILRLSVLAGELIQLAKLDPSTTVQTIEPRQWKGQVDPDVMCDRIIDLLLPSEATIAGACLGSVPSSYQHNVVDSLGIWLWSANRL